MRTDPGADTVTNLTVHGVGPTVRELDPGEDRTWVDVARLEQVLDAAVERPFVRITVDDGNASDVDVVLPRLLERGLKAEFFLLAGEIGEIGRVDRAGVRELVAAGMAIGSHGWAHRDWRRLDDVVAEEEIEGALRTLSRLSGQSVHRVAVPFGSYDRIVLRRLRHAGVSRVYTSDGGPARMDAWLQARSSLRSDVAPDWAQRIADNKAAAALRARRRIARSVKRWRGPLRPHPGGGIR